MSRQPAQRLLLEGVPREQWDPKHPGPLAHEIRPTHVDTDLVRFEIIASTEKQIEAYIKLPSDAQRRLGCDRCIKSHSPRNLQCAASQRHPPKPSKTYAIRSIITGAAIPGRWVATSWEVAPGYKSGRAVLNRR